MKGRLQEPPLHFGPDFSLAEPLDLRFLICRLRLSNRNPSVRSLNVKAKTVVPLFASTGAMSLQLRLVVGPWFSCEYHLRLIRRISGNRDDKNRVTHCFPDCLLYTEIYPLNYYEDSPKFILHVLGLLINMPSCLTKKSRRRIYDFSGELSPEGGRHGEVDDGNQGRNPAHHGGNIQEGKGAHARPCRGSYRLQQGLCLAPVVFILEPALPASMRQKRTPCCGCGKPSTLPT